MKRLLLSFLTLLLVLPAAFADSWTYAVTDDYTTTLWLSLVKEHLNDNDGLDITPTATNPKSDASVSDINWVCTSSMTTLAGLTRNSTGTRGFTIGSASSPVTDITFSTAGFKGKKITKVTLVISSISKKCYYDVDFTNGEVSNSVGKVLYQNNSGEANTDGTATFTPNNIADEFSFTIKNKGTTQNTKGGFKFCSISIEYENIVKGDAEATISVKDGMSMPCVSVGESISVDQLFSASVDGDDALTKKAVDGLKMKFADADADSQFVTIANDGKSLTINDYKTDQTSQYVTLTGYIDDVDGVGKTDSKDYVYLCILPTIKVSETMPKQLLVGQTVSVPVTIYPAEAISYVETEILDEESLSVTVDTDNSAISLTAKAEEEDNGFALKFNTNSSYNSGLTVNIDLPVVKGSIPEAIVTNPANKDGEIKVSAGDTVTFTSAGATMFEVEFDDGNSSTKEYFAGPTYSYTFNADGVYMVTIVPVEQNNGLTYYYNKLKEIYYIDVEEVEASAVELSINGDAERKIAYNGTIEKDWLQSSVAEALSSITYSVDEAGKDVVSVADDGTITALNPGTATVTATLSNPKYETTSISLKVTVGKIPVVLSIKDDAPTEVTVYGTLEAGWLSAKVDDKECSDALNYISYTVDTKGANYASVENGKITGIKSGEATITATIDENNIYELSGESATLDITVNRAKVTLSFTENALPSVAVGGTIKDWMTIDYGDLSDNEDAKDSLWSHVLYGQDSGNEKYVLVNQKTGEITGFAVGSATVWAAVVDDNYFDANTLTYELEVTEKPFDFTFDFTTNDYGMVRHSSDKESDTFNDTEVTIDSSQDSDPQTDPLISIYVKTDVKKNRLWDSKGWRFNSSSSDILQISIDPAYAINKIQILGNLMSETNISNYGTDKGVFQLTTSGSSNVGIWNSTSNTNSVKFSFTPQNNKDITTITVYYTKLPTQSATITANNSQVVGCGDSKELTFSIEPDDAAQYIVASTDDENISFSQNENGKWIVTGVNSTESASYTLSLGSCPYTAESVDGTIRVISGKAKADPECDENGKLTAKLNKDVTFASKGAEKLSIAIEKDDHTYLAEQIVDNGYKYQFSEAGVYKVIVSPLYRDENAEYLPYPAEYNLMQCFTVTATPVEYEEGCDVLDYENMTINSAYKVKRNTSELTSVSYAAFAYRSNASAIQLNSGKWVMSTDNPNGRIIQKILMTSNNNMTLYMGNDSYSLTGDDGATSTTISKGSDAKEIAGTKTTIDGSTYYVYTPDAEYKYFAITASSSTSVKQIQVYYTEVIKSNPEMEMCEDGTTTAVELKNIDFYMADLYDGNECTKLSYATDSADREAIYSDATITYESSDNKVAKVDENTGDLTIRGMGTAIITASYSGNKNYVPTKATYTINVGLFQPSDNDDSAETDLHCPLIFDEDDTLLTSAYTESGQVLQTDKLTIRYKPGYDLYYSFVYDKSQGEGTLNKNVRAADTDGSNVTYTKLETTESANGDYIYAEISPYTELYASTIQIYAQSQSDSSLKSNTLTLHLDKPTGVHALTAEDGEAEAVYYTLQGQRVKNPERGIYIRVCGNKATKVAL